MQIVKETGTQYDPVFISIFEDIPGGVSFTCADLKTATEEVGAGALVGEDGSTAGKYHLIKTAIMQAAAVATATTLRVEKNHEFVVGDFITNGQVSTEITVIATTETLYDTITITATLDALEEVADETVLYQGASETSNAATAAVATVEDTEDDFLIITSPRGVGNAITVTISQAGGDTLAVTYTLATRTLAIALANSTGSKNTIALIQAAIRALLVHEGIDFSDWTATGAEWGSAQTGGTLTTPTDYMVGGVEKPVQLDPLYIPKALIRNNIDVTGTVPAVSVGAVTIGTAIESLLPFSVTAAMKATLRGITFV